MTLILMNEGRNLPDIRAKFGVVPKVITNDHSFAVYASMHFNLVLSLCRARCKIDLVTL